MSRSTLVPALIVCLGITIAAFANATQDAATLGVDADRTKAPTAADFQALVLRVERLERQLSDRKEQQQLGRGFVAIEPIVANLDESGLSRYIRIVPVLAIEDGQKQLAADALLQLSPKINDRLYWYLSGMALEDVRGQENQERMRAVFQTYINSEFKQGGYDEFAKEVLFDKFVIQ